MNKIFIEAKDEKTSEYHFLSAILEKFFPDKTISKDGKEGDIKFVCINGIGNLFNDTNKNQMSQALDEGNTVLILVDADYHDKNKKTGYTNRKKDINEKMKDFVLPFFIYPNNKDDGSVEVLMEAAARRDLHSVVFDCFEDYEKCVSGVKDDNGQARYNTPNIKGKLHTYITAQKLSSKKRDKLGSGDWLFNDTDFWDLDTESLKPLIAFLKENLK